MDSEVIINQVSEQSDINIADKTPSKSINYSNFRPLLNIIILSLIAIIILFLYIFPKLKIKEESITKEFHNQSELIYPIDKDWQPPEKNRLFGLHCTKASELNQDDECFLTIMEFLHPETERVLSKITFDRYNGDQKSYEANYVRIMSASKDKVILYVYSNIKGGHIDRNITVDIQTGSQEIISDNIGGTFQLNNSYLDADANTLFGMIYKGNRNELIGYNLATKEVKTILESGQDISFAVIAKISPNQYLIKEYLEMAVGKIYLCNLSSSNKCEIKSNTLYGFDSEPANNWVGRITSDPSPQYNDKATRFTLNVTNVQSNETKELLSIKNDSNVMSKLYEGEALLTEPYKSIDKYFFSPSGKSVVALTTDSMQVSSSEDVRRLQGWILDEQDISPQETELIKQINAKELGSFLSRGEPELLNWIEYLDDEGKIKQGFLWYDSFLPDIFDEKSMTPLFTKQHLDGLIPVYPGANRVLDYLLDPVMPSGKTYHLLTK